MPLNFDLQPLPEGAPNKIGSRFRVLISLWPTIAAIIAAAIWTFLSYREGKFGDDFPDFKFQAELFGYWGLVGVVTGLNVGWTNQNAKLAWSCVDIVWITTALLALPSILGPVEQQVMKWRAADEANTAVQLQNEILNEVAMGLKMACSQPAAQPKSQAHCAQWTNFQRELTVGKPTPTDTLERLKTALPNVQASAQTAKTMKNIIEARGKLITAGLNEQKARHIIDNFDLAVPYLNLFILTVALSARAGKSGADLGKAWAESWGKGWPDWWASRRKKGWAEWWSERPRKSTSKKTVFTSVSVVQPGGPHQTRYIRLADINFVLHDANPDHSVIYLVSEVGMQVKKTVAHSLERLAEGFPSLTKAEILNEQGACTGTALLNLDRVIVVDPNGDDFIVHFANGRNLRVRETSTREELVPQKMPEQA